MSYIKEKLEKYADNGRIPMHMPGHKRNFGGFTYSDTYKIDITEIDGFDDYHYPEDILHRSMERTTNIYKTKESIYLVNGSSCGILAAISTTTKRNGRMIVARNCHKSVYHAMEIMGIQPEYVYPQYIESMGINSTISAEAVDNILKNNNDIKSVIITSPTYEGIVSDINKIAEIIHSYDATLIVDEAHGAHFNYSDRFPVSAVECGADIVIQSLHKTLPSYTQTAILHVCSNRIDVDKLQHYLGIYQSSSPSYVFMSGIEGCIEYMDTEGRVRIEEYYDRVLELRNNIEKLSGIKLLKYESGMKDYDISKIVIGSDNITGSVMAEILRDKYNIEPEMVAKNYIILMTSLCDDFKWYDVVYEAVKTISETEKKENKIISNGQYTEGNFRADIKMSPQEAYDAEFEEVALFEALGRISKDTIYAYPPGIPIIMPGEVITEEVLDIIKNNQISGVRLKGLTDKRSEVIRCIK